MPIEEYVSEHLGEVITIMAMVLGGLWGLALLLYKRGATIMLMGKDIEQLKNQTPGLELIEQRLTALEVKVQSALEDSKSEHAAIRAEQSKIHEDVTRTREDIARLHGIVKRNGHA